MFWAKVRFRPLLKCFREVFDGGPVMKLGSARVADSARFILLRIIETGKGGETFGINAFLAQVAGCAIGVSATIKASLPYMKPTTCHYRFS